MTVGRATFAAPAALGAALWLSSTGLALAVPGPGSAPSPQLERVQIAPPPAHESGTVVELVDPRHPAIRIEVPVSDLEAGAPIEEHYRKLLKTSSASANTVVVENGRIYFRSSGAMAMARPAVEVVLQAAENASETQALEAQAAAPAPRIFPEPPAPLRSSAADKDVLSLALRRPRFTAQKGSPHLHEPEAGDLVQGLEVGIERAPLPAEAENPALAASTHRDRQDPAPLDYTAAIDSISSELRLKFVSVGSPAGSSGRAPERSYAVIALESRGTVALSSLVEAGEWLVSARP
jgi:hypothetical protein